MVETFLNGQCREFSARNAERKRTPCKEGGGSPIIPHDEPPAAVLFYTWYAQRRTFLRLWDEIPALFPLDGTTQIHVD